MQRAISLNTDTIDDMIFIGGTEAFDTHTDVLIIIIGIIYVNTIKNFV